MDTVDFRKKAGAQGRTKEPVYVGTQLPYPTANLCLILSPKATTGLLFGIKNSFKPASDFTLRASGPMVWSTFAMDHRDWFSLITMALISPLFFSSCSPRDGTQEPLCARQAFWACIIELNTRLPKPFRTLWKNSYLLALSCYALSSMFAVSNTLVNGWPKEDQGGFPWCKADGYQELKQDRRLAKQDIQAQGLTLAHQIHLLKQSSSAANRDHTEPPLLFPSTPEDEVRRRTEPSVPTCSSENYIVGRDVLESCLEWPP